MLNKWSRVDEAHASNHPISARLIEALTASSKKQSQINLNCSPRTKIVLRCSMSRNEVRRSQMKFTLIKFLIARDDQRKSQSSHIFFGRLERSLVHSYVVENLLWRFFNACEIAGWMRVVKLETVKVWTWVTVDGWLLVFKVPLRSNIWLFKQSTRVFPAQVNMSIP